MATTKTAKKTVQENTAPASPPKTATAVKTAASKKETTAPTKTPAKAAAPQPATKKVIEPKPKATPASIDNAAPAATAAVSAAPPVGKWKEVQQILLDMKEQTLLEIKRSIKKGSETSVGEEPTGDIYDQASSERDRELGLLLNDREREKLHSIDEALLRIAEGEYGICEECDEDIPMGRLKVLPFTRHCVKCKSDLEKFQAQTRRIEEDRAYREIPVGDEDEG
ncbi:transcriptional regulator, TraR/DksA family [Trichlorobacter thiogenes]|uniref:Transcriptional regulator, TraR/DksA family n=1 Tax=Trichlorobacter thiogenes TaxID=115783 RepID=A0A1T4LZW9_9BACT|nr:TraR/DksA family transcriptional regulator [Trichlorobacter thiogenes]SJZ60058.1 transcriptional regulator, TraR/DksA family [Trichlorobacter thiogenes]